MSGTGWDSPPRLPARSGIEALAVLGLAVLLIALAAPRFVASLMKIPGNAAVADLYAGKPVDPARLDGLLAAYGAAAGWIGEPDIRFQLARGLVERSRQGRDKTALAEAMTHLEAALEMAPAHPAAWAQLADIASLSRETWPRAGRALAMSVLTGPFEAHLMAYRLRVALRIWPGLDAETRRLMFQDARHGVERNPRQIAALADTPMARGVIRAALAADPVQLVRFERALQSHLRRR